MTEPGDRRGDDSAHGLGPTRARVLALLQDAGTPLTTASTAERLALHVNTARFHLEALAEAGLVTREVAASDGRGRPRLLYAATPASPPVSQRSYRFLAEVLTSLVSDQFPDPAASAEQAGHAWGRHLTPPSDRHPDDNRTAQALVATLDRVGFESHAAGDDGARSLEITHCPFLEVAAEHPEIVCSVHLGLLRGAAEQLDAPLSVDRLDPLVAPGLCVARLGPRSAARGTGHARKATTSSRAGAASGIGSSG